MTIKDTGANTLKTLEKSHDKAINWVKTHESIFVSTKYQLIHFRKNIFINFEFFFRPSNHVVNWKINCKYLKIIMNRKLHRQNHLQYLKKQSANKLTVFSIFAEFTWIMETKDLKRTYLVVVFFFNLFTTHRYDMFSQKNTISSQKKRQSAV